MMRGMRRLVLLLMIALLPARMWAAELMTLRMAEAELAPTAIAMPADCPMLATAGADDQAAQPAGKLCIACPLCAAVAAAAIAVAGPAPAPLPASKAPASRYASAEARPEHKPPIS